MIKIVVDSACDLNQEIKEKINIVSVPLNLTIGEKNYVDDQNLDKDQFLIDMEKSKKPCRSSAPSPELYFDAYKGKEDIFVVTLSSKLSGSYNSAITAKQLYLEKFGEKFIHVFDSLSASVGETLTALKINELVKLNETKEKIINSVNEFIDNLQTYFTLEKFNNFAKNGRVNQYIAKLASLLGIKLICKGKNGEVELVAKAHGREKALDKLVDMIAGNVIDAKKKILGITHVKCIEKALRLKENILSKIKFKDIIIMEATGICSMYAERGGIVLVF